MSKEADKETNKGILMELQIGIDTKNVVTLCAQFRKTGLSWPNSLAQALDENARQKLTEDSPLHSLMLNTFYDGLLQTIEQAENIRTNGPEPGSDFIFAWTDDIEEQAEYFMQVRDEQLAQVDALEKDPSGVKLLELQLGLMMRGSDAPDPEVVENLNALVSKTVDFRAINWEDLDLSKFVNRKAYARMLAYSDFRQFMEYLEDKLYLIDYAIELGKKD